MPVPPPTLPSATGPAAASASAWSTWAALTWKPLMSLRMPSQVSPTTGSPHMISRGSRVATSWAMRPSRTTPTLWVLVSAIGEVSMPDSRTHSSPVSSPLPLSRWQPANTGSSQTLPSCGRITVTPVRTGPRPTCSGPSPSISVAWPTRTPATSVMASPGPGTPVPTSTPRSLARIPATPYRGGAAGVRDAGLRAPVLDRHSGPQCSVLVADGAVVIWLVWLAGVVELLVVIQVIVQFVDEVVLPATAVATAVPRAAPQTLVVVVLDERVQAALLLERLTRPIRPAGNVAHDLAPPSTSWPISFNVSVPARRPLRGAGHDSRGS